MSRKIVLLFVFLLALAIPAVAQDATAEPTVEVTPEVTPVPPVDNEPPAEEPEAPPAPLFDTVTAGELGLFLLLSVLAGGGILAIVLRFLERKDVRDRVEDARNSWTEEQQEFLRKFTDTLRDTNNRILDFLESVQDGKPNQ